MDWLHNGIFRLSSEHFSGCLGITLMQYFINSWTLELEISLIWKFPFWMKLVCLCRALTECYIGCTFILTGVYQLVCLKRLMNFTCLSHCLLLSNLYARRLKSTLGIRLILLLLELWRQLICNNVVQNLTLSSCILSCQDNTKRRIDCE